MFCGRWVCRLSRGALPFLVILNFFRWIFVHVYISVSLTVSVLNIENILIQIYAWNWILFCSFSENTFQNFWGHTATATVATAANAANNDDDGRMCEQTHKPIQPTIAWISFSLWPHCTQFHIRTSMRLMKFAEFFLFFSFSFSYAHMLRTSSGRAAFHKYVPAASEVRRFFGSSVYLL